MLRDRTGAKYELNSPSRPNPLLEKQGENWRVSEVVVANDDSLGIDLVAPPVFTQEDCELNLDRIGEDVVIRKANGEEYKLNGDLRLFDPQSVDHDLMHSVDKEVIETAGSPVYYYKVHIDENNYDDLYMEARNKTRSQEGIMIYAQWEPVTPNNEMGAFGIDSPDEIVFNFNIRDFKEKVGEDIPQVGALFYTPFDKNWWEIIQANYAPQGEAFKIWGRFRFAVLARKYQRSIADHEPSRLEPGQSARNIIIR